MATKGLPLAGVFCAVSAALGLAASGAAQPAGAAAQPSYTYATNGILDGIRNPGGTTWKLVLNESILGGNELDLAEVTLPSGSATPSHTHAPLEVLYVLSGIYDHEVNGKRYRLSPGMVGIVRPGDQVRHIATNGTDVKLLVIWIPAGNTERFASAEGTVPAPVPEVTP
jgi:quercetin dioxygenase-like cupin family protein